MFPKVAHPETRTKLRGHDRKFRSRSRLFSSSSVSVSAPCGALRGMSRKVLAKVSGISERYIAQLESGKGQRLDRAVAPGCRMRWARISKT